MLAIVTVLRYLLSYLLRLCNLWCDLILTLFLHQRFGLRQYNNEEDIITKNNLYIPSTVITYKKKMRNMQKNIPNVTRIWIHKQYDISLLCTCLCCTEAEIMFIIILIISTSLLWNYLVLYFYCVAFFLFILDKYLGI